MDKNWPTSRDYRHHARYDESDRPRVPDSDAGADSSAGYGTYPAFWGPGQVDANALQHGQPGILGPLSSAGELVLSTSGVACPAGAWTSVEVSPHLFTDHQTGQSPAPYSHPVFQAYQAASGPPAADPIQPAGSFTKMEEQPMMQPGTYPAMCEEEEEEEEEETEVTEDTLLKSLREAGCGFGEISKRIRDQLGITITANALVKRYRKMTKTSESLLANAIANIMPQIMEQLYFELLQMDLGTLSDEEKQAVDRMLHDLPRVLPNCVRSSLARRRRTMRHAL